MPRKIRELKQDLRRAGFVELKGRGKGSHAVFSHPNVELSITIPGQDGKDAQRYLEIQVRQRIQESKR